MRKMFVFKEFRADKLEMIYRCQHILAQYAEAGYDLTLRQLFYQVDASALME